MKKLSSIECFASKIERDFETECWLWTGSIGPDGYGRIKIGKRPVLAHRFSYESLVLAIPKGLQLDHLCRVRRCVNPAHLEPVTQQVNIARGESGLHQRMKTQCPQGHEYTEKNTRRYKGWRFCRACDRSRCREETKN